MAKRTRFDEILSQYASKYDIETLNSPNDKANLDMLINNQIIVENLQAQLLELSADSVANIAEIQKISNAMRDLIERSLQIERALALDRKTRKSENSDSVASYITDLKVTAQNFLDKRLIKVYCPDCKILVARLGPTMDHTAFYFEAQCSQCSKRVIAKRTSAPEGVLFDIKDYRWRKSYVYEVIPPTRSVDTPQLQLEEDINLLEEANGPDEEA